MTGVDAASLARLRYGILLDGPAVHSWQFATLDHLERSGVAELALVVVADGNRARARWRPRKRGSRESLGRMLRQAALHAFATYMSRSSALQRFDGVPWSDDVSIIHISPVSSTPTAFTVREEDLEAIRAHRLDFLIWHRPGTPTGDLLQTARYGVWSFEFGDERLYRGGPPGFWELVDGQPVVGATLQGAMVSADHIITLRKGWFAVAPDSYGRTRDRLFMGVAGWPAQVCREILLGAGPDLQPSPAAPAGRRPMRLRSFFRFLGVILRARLRKYWHHGLRHDDWNIGVVDAPVASFLAGDAVRDVAWAPARKGHYSADPFGRREDGVLSIFYEDYSHAQGAASIATRRWTREGGWERSEPALEVGSHLSYPFLIEEEGRWLLLPESRASGELVLYEADRVDGSWRPLADLGLGGDVADATLLRQDGLWWLFAVRADRLNPATELHLWFAKQPEGPWQGHPLNPVLVDVRSARPAGPFFREGGQLYRPAQDCSTGYGDRVAIKRVVILTTERYGEEIVRFLEAERDGPFGYGLHTLSGVGDVTLVDGKRRVWSTAATARAIRRRVPL